MRARAGSRSSCTALPSTSSGGGLEVRPLNNKTGEKAEHDLHETFLRDRQGRAHGATKTTQTLDFCRRQLLHVMLQSGPELSCARDLDLPHRQPKQPVPLKPRRSDVQGTSSSSSLQPTQREQAYSDMMSSIVERARQDLAQAHAREEEELEHMLSRTDRDQSGFVRDIDTYIEMHQAIQLQHKQQLCRSWHNQVYNVIQGQVDAQLARLSPRELNIRRNQLMDSYLRTCNQKPPGLFRDIFFPPEYEPMRAHETCIRYSVSSITDPLKADWAAPPTHSALTPRGSAGLGRITVDVTTWSKLDGTPYRQISPRKFAASGADGGNTASLQGIFAQYAPASIST